MSILFRPRQEADPHEVEEIEMLARGLIAIACKECHSTDVYENTRFIYCTNCGTRIDTNK